MVDHVSHGNQRWRNLLENLHTWPTPITREWRPTQSECGCKLWAFSQKLEALLVDHMSVTLYRRRRQLAGGVQGNGFEMWRRLLNKFQGESEAIQLGRARRLQEWRRCTKLDQLSAHIDERCDCLQQH